MQNICFLALPQGMSSSISLPMEMLNAAYLLSRSQQGGRKQTLSIKLAAPTLAPVKTTGGLTLLPDCAIDDIKHTDLLILPALWRNPQKALSRYPELLPWIQQQAKQDAMICAVGTSSCWLAEAGLLDGKPATTHWFYCDEFERRYPRVQLKRQYLITQADKLYCAGSVNSVADLMVHLIGEQFGESIAHRVESQFSPEIRRPFESHAYAEHETNLHQDEAIIEAQQQLRLRASTDISLQGLAAELGLTMRSFNRRFKQATDTTPGAYLQNLRFNIARELLRTSNVPVTEVAALSGYPDSSYFSARFKKQLGQTPLAYRKSVRGKLFKVS